MVTLERHADRPGAGEGPQGVLEAAQADDPGAGVLVMILPVYEIVEEPLVLVVVPAEQVQGTRGADVVLPGPAVPASTATWCHLSRAGGVVLACAVAGARVGDPSPGPLVCTSAPRTCTGNWTRGAGVLDLSVVVATQGRCGEFESLTDHQTSQVGAGVSG